MLNRWRQAASDEAGLTLVELLTVIVILGVIGGFVTNTVITALEATRKGEARVMALNDLQRGVERVGRELRAAEELKIATGTDPAGNVGAQVVRDGQRITYRYYLVDVGDGAELREDVVRQTLAGAPIDARNGLFIADIANLETDTPLFTYYVTNPTTGQLAEIDCATEGLTTSQCEQRHATATQIQLTLEKLLPEQAPIQVETIVNVRSVRIQS
jgi:prepilin-type N-terminal cleavage/methylation domain-containing protein